MLYKSFRRANLHTTVFVDKHGSIGDETDDYQRPGEYDVHIYDSE